MKILSFLIVILASATSFAQHLDCSNFKSGHFRYLNKDYADLLTIRTDTTQIDVYSETSDFKATSHLKWLSDCRYKFEYYKVNDPRFKSIIGTTYTVEITEIKADTIVCHKVVNEKLQDSMLMFKIKD
ncbi:hypothetical protein WNY78_07005 [Psychroserpens sp. AS72]|uniref:hypothetical protein n=1 Tax=Psychroserpens sp. AS72 TaxID=3135775 RepID=UPI00317958D8